MGVKIMAKTEDSCETISKVSLERQIVAPGDSVSQIKIIIDATYKCGRKNVLEWLNDWYNNGVFDYLSCLYSALSHELPKNIFFRAVGVFRDYIDICSRQPVGLVIDIAEKSCKLAGADLSSGLALEKAEAYLSRHPDDIDNAIVHCERTNPYGNGSQHVWIAALAYNSDLYWKRFLSWIDAAEKDDEIATTMRTLAQIPEKTGGVASTVVDVVERIVKVHGLCLNDDVKGALYLAAEAWRKVVDCQHRDALEKIANNLLNEGCPFVLYFATREAWLSAKQQSMECVDAWLSAFVKVDPKHKGIIENLSYYLHELLDSHPEKVFVFIENYSREHSSSITVFNNIIISKISDADETLRNKYFTRWLASDSISVARNVYEIVSHVRPDTTLHINVVFDQPVKYSAGELLLIFLRAIGWLYSMPETCIGFLVSCAQKMHEESLKFVYDDFFYLVVLSYVEEYVKVLKQVSKEDEGKPYYKYLKKLERDALNWWERLKATGECLELSPSIRHKELYAKHRSEVYGKAMKEARDNSVLSQIAHNICLLHGRGWIVPVHTADGEKMEESLLKRFSASIRISRLSEIEEHTLETRLTELRHVRWEPRP